ncbi:MAG: TonB family protein [Pelosinus sp.]|jgi:protein TonB|nr:TonB family protein [Pelosinus sp.]
MAYHLRWRRAAIVSVLCHLFFFIGASYLSAHLFTPTIQEQVIELELVSELAAESREDSASPNAPMSPPASPEQVLPSTSTPATPKVVSSIDVAEALPVTGISSNEPASVPSGSTGSGNTDSVSTINGTGNTGATGKRGGFIPPSILSKVEPPYPQAARQAGMEGTVLVKIEILANGRSGNILVSRSSGHEILDEAAMDTVEQWRFVPAKDRNSGQAIACYTTIPISFRLK